MLTEPHSLSDKTPDANSRCCKDNRECDASRALGFVEVEQHKEGARW